MRKMMSIIIVEIMITASLVFGSYTGSVTMNVNDIQIVSQNGYDAILIEGDYEFTKEIGNPQLPCKTLSYIIPLESSVENITINSTQLEIIDDREYNVLPTQPPLETDDGDIIEFVLPNEEVYSSGLLYPNKILEIKSEEYRFGYHIVTVEVYPVQYDTDSKELKVYSDINFTLNYTGSKDSYTLPEKQNEKIYKMTRKMIKSQIENPDDMNFLTGGAKEVIKQNNVVRTITKNKSMPLYAFTMPEYVIITSEEFKEEFQKLADWKTKKGVPAIVVEIDDIMGNYTGDVKERIVAYLAEQYSKFGIFYVLLGGDTNTIPTNLFSATGRPYDEYYMDVTSDNGLELLVGRAPVEDINEAENFISKTINYEKLTGLNDEERSYVSNLLVLNGIDGETITTVEDQKYIYTIYNSTTRGKYDWISDNYASKNINSLKLYEKSENPYYLTEYPPYELSLGNLTLSKMNALGALSGNINLNDYNGNNTQDNHFGMVLHFDHSSPTALGTGAHQNFNTYIPAEMIYRTDAYELENNNGEAIFSNILLTEGCNPGYLFKDCIVERLLNNPNGGSVAALANVQEGSWGSAGLHQRFMDAVYNLYNSEDYEDSYHIGIAHQIMGFNSGKTLFGDPELPIWTKTPDKFDNVTVFIVNADGNTGYIDNEGNYAGAYISTGENQIIVHTGETIETIVCLNKTGEAYVYNQAEGSATFTYTPDTAEGNIELTVTGKDYLPYELSIPIDVSNQAYLFIAEKTVYDGNSVASVGDSDGFIDGGETIELPIIIKNTSLNTITSITGDLSTDNEYITISSPTSNYNNISSMESQNCLNNYIFSVDNDIPDGEIVVFTFTITTDQDIFTEMDSLRAKNSKLLVLDRLELVEINEITGAEHFEVTLEISNYGNSELNNLTVNISSSSTSSVKNIQPSNFNYVFIDSLETDASAGTFSFDLVDGNHDALIEIDVEDGNGRLWHYEFNTLYTSIEGSVIDLNSVETTSYKNGIAIKWDPLNDNMGSSCRFNIYRSTEINGEYEKLNLTPLVISGDGMRYTDLNCQDYTRYFYRFSTLYADQSNINVGSMSDAVASSTLLSATTGWPVKSIELCRLNNAPSVADIDNDGEDEIFVTGSIDNDGYIVGFNVDGSEITNYLGASDDMNGFAVIDGKRIWSKSALGDIDNDGINEVVVATRSSTQSLCVYKYTNSSSAPELMNFPIDFGQILTEPVIADIDNNGVNDIIIADENGRICAYEYNGSTFEKKTGWPRSTGSLTTGGWTTGGIAVGDINNDGYKEIVFGGRDGLYAFNYDGEDYLGAQPFFSTGVTNEAFWCNPVIVNMDLKSDSEIIVVSNVIIPKYGTSIVGKIYILNSDGTIYNEGNSSYSWNGVSIYMKSNEVFLPNISVADVTEGFEPEVFIGGNRKLYGFDNWGEPLWVINNLDLVAIKANPVIADIDGDSKYEIVISSSSNSLTNMYYSTPNSLIYAYNSEDGTPALGWPLIGNGQTPFIGDVNKDNKNEVVTSDGEESTYTYDTEGIAEYIEWQSYRANPENTGVYRKTLYEVTVGSTINLSDQQKIEVSSDQYIRLLENSSLILESGSELVIKAGCTLRLYSGSKLIINEGANLVLEEGAIVEIEGNTIISGDLTVGNNVLVDIKEKSTLSLGFVDLNITDGATLKLQADSKLINLNGSHLVFDYGSMVEVSENAEIVVMNKSYFTAKGTTFSYIDATGKWLGINCLGGSTVDFDNVSIFSAETGIKGDGTYKFDVVNSTFEGCINGIDLLGMSSGYEYTIENNTLTGTDEGRGIMITGADGTFSKNNVTHFNIGVYFVLCSPVVSSCEITYSKHYGMLISGNDAMPILISTEDQIPIYKSANCTFAKNAYEGNTALFPSAHIGIIPTGNIYMRNNDVYSSPNFPAISIAQKDIRDQHITVDVQYNYWGYPVIEDDHFFGHPDYTIDYTPYYSAPCGTDIAQSEIMQSISTESRIVSNALNLELKDKITPAIKLFEHIIDKYVDTPEYYVAMSRLPYLYEQAELDNNELITMYEEAIESEETSHKKFFKGRKVATHIKGKRFDEAIAIAEMMKEEADNDEEILLAEINIGIANMLKDLENNGKSRTDNSQNIRDLISKLDVTDGDEEKTDIAGSTLPTEFTLEQNYPNPFNPVTQIQFALPTTGKVKLNVFNINGQLVSELLNGSKEAGIHKVNFDASNFNSGMYFYTLEVNGMSITKKMILMK
ncbi:MAG: C25 family cysteine peptidase [Candidatus Delongbacteria bacterium]|jgi:hypothetical protein|nr:C25 family cysteine peptidase [Candidatus Delongbacteria bacterium]